MSIEDAHGLIGLVIERSAARGTARMVLVGLAYHADADGSTFPSIARLAAYAKVHRRNVQRALDELVRLGEIAVVTARRGGGGGGTMTRYRITVANKGGAGATRTDSILPDSTAQHSRARAQMREAIEEATAIVTELRAVAATAWPGDPTPGRWLATDVVHWLGQGAHRLLIVDTVAGHLARMSQGGRTPPLVLRYFNAAIDKAIAEFTRALPQATNGSRPRLDVIDGGVT